MKQLFFFILLIGAFSVLKAQQIEGLLKDETGEPIPYASIAIKSAVDSSVAKTTMSGEDGTFNVEVDEGSYLAFIQYFGFQSFTSEVFQVGEEGYSIPEIQLEEEVTALDELVIVTEKPLLQKTARGMVVNMDASTIMSNGSTREALTKIPGVVVQQDGSVSLKGKNNVIIYMDGKRTYMSLQQLVQYLEGLPASDIEKIEVFDTPPAKFDAEGDAGIINIVLKKGVALGFNGMTGVNAAYGKYHKLTQWGNFNYRKPKYNVYGGGWIFDRPNHEHFDSRTELDSASIIFDVDTRTQVRGGGGRVGFDWFLDKKSTIGLLVLGYKGSWSAVSTGYNELEGNNSNTFNNSVTDNDRSFPWLGFGYNLNYTKDIKDGEKLSIDLDMVKQTGSQKQLSESKQYFDDNFLSDQFITTVGETDKTILASKVDYERKLNDKWKVETGLKASSVRSNSEQEGSSGTDLNQLIPSPNNSSDFNYLENIYAGYAVIAGKVRDKIDIDGGFRVEYTDVTGKTETLNNSYERGYLTVFPNVGLNYKSGKKSDLSLSFAKRIGRPQYWQLTPYIVQVSEYNYEIGNPELRPQNTSVYSFGYSWEKAVYATLSYNHTTNAMTYVSDLNEANQTTNNYTTNLDDIYNYSLNLVVPVPIKKWWKANINFTTFYNHQSSDFKDLGIDNKLMSYNFNIQNYIDLPKKYKFELRGFYNSKNYWMTQLLEPQYQMSVGLSKQFNRLNVSLTYQDIFNWKESNGIINQKGLNSKFYYKNESQQVKFSINYRFGSDKVKEARKRESASQDLQDR